MPEGGFADLERGKAGALATAWCPGEVQLGDVCVIGEDLAIEETIVVPEHGVLQCRAGATITPAAPGQLSTGGQAYLPSTPDTAVLAGGPGARIQNCGIEGFTFGVAVLGVSSPGGVTGADRVRIQGNDIEAQTFAVLLMSADDVLVADNVLSTTSAGGVAVNVIRDSDRNEIVGNDITGASHLRSTEPLGPWGFPGGLDTAVMHSTTSVPTYGTSPTGTPFLALGVQVGAGAANTVFYVAVSGRLYQYPFDGYPEDNLVAYNTFDLPGVDSQALLLGFSPRGTTFLDNDVLDAAIGISYGSERFRDLLVPGGCSHDATRLCTVDSHCHFAGIDGDETLSSVCNNPPPGVVRAMDSLTSDTTIIGNDIAVHHTPSFLGPLQLGGGIIDRGCVGSVIQGNTVRMWQCPPGATCPSHPPGPSFGIRLSGSAIEASMVTDNVVSGMPYALMLGMTGDKTATHYGAVVSRNDFADSTIRAIIVRGATWNIPGTDLSSDGVGNYWGHDEAPGYLSSDSPSSLIVDTNPFCEPVAGLDTLPPTCP